MCTIFCVPAHTRLPALLLSDWRSRSTKTRRRFRSIAQHRAGWSAVAAFGAAARVTTLTGKHLANCPKNKTHTVYRRIKRRDTQPGASPQKDQHH